MINVLFICDIESNNGELIERDFDFDRGTFDNIRNLEQYKDSCNYEIGKPCCYWGDDVGILKEIVIEEI